MTFMRYLSPTLDNMFMDSLAWVDKTYMQKHQSENPEQLRAMYYPNLKLYDSHGSQQERDPWDAAMKFLKRFGKKAALSLSIYMLSFLPYVGRFVLPAASFYTFNKEAGLQPAVLIFGSALFLPKKYLVMFLQSFFSSRSLMRELVRLSPICNSNAKSLLTGPHSSNPTSPAYNTRPPSAASGSTIVREFSTVSQSPSSSSSRFRSWASSSTGSQKPQQPTSSRKSLTHLPHPPKPRSSRKRTSDGRTSTSS